MVTVKIIMTKIQFAGARCDEIETSNLWLK